MDEYSVYLYTKNKVNRQLAEKLVKSSLQLGFEFANVTNSKIYSVDSNEAIDLLSAQESCLMDISLKENKCKFFSVFKGNKLTIETDYTTKTWLNEFKYGFDVDNITVSRIILDLTASFLLDDFYIKAPEEWETFNELKKGEYIEDYNNDLSQFNIPNSVTADFLIGNYCIDDATDIINIAQKNGYNFYNLNNEKLNYNQAETEIFLGILKVKDHEITKLLIEFQGHYSQIIFNNGLVTLALKEPYKMKTVEGQTGIDIAYYLRILLNLAEPFGFYELECNIKQID